MNIHDTKLPDVKVLEPKIFKDKRGYFFESFNQSQFEEMIGSTVSFKQDNQSKSARGVLRGLHYQLPPKAQGKLVRVINGEVFDVAVDIRRTSPTFGHWVGQIISAENKRQIWIPEGFAHGFLTLSRTAVLLYKSTEYYAPECERSIRWDDPIIGIKWPTSIKPILSKTDRVARFLDK